MQSGEQVTRLDDLQDIDELHVIEVCLLAYGDINVGRSSLLTSFAWVAHNDREVSMAAPVLGCPAVELALGSLLPSPVTHLRRIYAVPVAGLRRQSRRRL